MRDCDQCVVESFNFNDNKELPRKDAAVQMCDDQCPKCRIWICMDCFIKDHIFCEGPGLDMVYDLGAISLARAKEDHTPATEFYKPHIAEALKALPRIPFPRTRLGLMMLDEADS